MDRLVEVLRGPALVLAFCCLVGCGAESRPVQLSGSIFGTTWSLSYLGAPDAVSPAQVEAELDAAFALVNRSMNHYDPASLISTFNASGADVSLQVDWDFAYVLSSALEISAATAGAYDVSVSPLSDLWGFGPAGPVGFPDQTEINAVLEDVGMSRLSWHSATRMLSKDSPGLKLDFSSLAKGYAVDKVVEAIEALGHTNYMVEIGGEVFAKGTNPKDGPWRIGIETPSAHAPGIFEVVTLSGQALATSGDYRNFYENNGQRFSHTIDPRTGRPIKHKLASVSVLSKSCAQADAMATALNVLGPVDGPKLAQEKGIAALFIIRDAAGKLQESQTSGFANARQKAKD